MGKMKISYMTAPLEKILEAIGISKASLHNRTPEKLSPAKDSRAYYLSNFAFTTIQFGGEREAVGPAGLIENWARDYFKSLPDEDQQRIQLISNTITNRRQELIEALIEEKQKEATAAKS